MARVKYQLKKLSRGQATNPRISPLWALVAQQIKTARQTKQYRLWVANR